MKDYPLNRRRFLQWNAMAGAVLLAPPFQSMAASKEKLLPEKTLQGLRETQEETPLENAQGYEAAEVGDGLLFRFEKGLLSQFTHLCSDFLLGGEDLAVFQLFLKEGEEGPTFSLGYKGLNHCQGRIRFPLKYVDQSRWKLEREGAWLKPICGWDRVDLEEVDRMILRVAKKSPRPVRWCQSPFYLMKEEPPRIQSPVLPKGSLLDEMGQCTFREWPGRTKTTEELIERLKTQYKDSEKKSWPKHFTQWGGWKKRKVEASGFFRTHHDGDRWWLVDPDGYYYWSAGLDCVRSSISAKCEGIEEALSWRPDPDRPYKQAYGGGYVDYLKANFIRAFGADDWHDRWSRISISLLKDIGFNTVANWSEWEIARKSRFPYVRPLSTRLPRSKRVYRDFPDVYHSDFEKDAKDYAKQLEITKEDPAFLGYFLMNEPTWGFSSESPAAGMLFNTPQCECRKKLAEFLGQRYEDAKALSKAWDIETTFEEIREGEWKKRLSQQAKEDLYAFSAIMVERFFGTLSEECKKVDPDHLNLGIRYQGVPPDWTVEGMKYFDVFSMNSYREKVPRDTCRKIEEKLNMPVLIGEYHFGALDVGLPSPGLVHVASQEDRGKAYRCYFEDAVDNPYCVGVHYFTMYDQSALGRFDGENYNIGFLDICNKPYKPFVHAARKSHLRMYEIADGKAKPYEDSPEFLPRLF